MTNKQLRNHIGKITLLTILAVVFAIMTFICAAGYQLLTEYCYNLWLDPPKQADTQVRVDTIKQAIQLHPTQTQGYLNILDAYTEDGVLTEKEKGQVTELLKQYRKDLGKNEDASDVYKQWAFDIISCYEADAQTRLKAAYNYFSIVAVEENTEAHQATLHAAYLDAGAYYHEYLNCTGTPNMPSAIDAKNMIKKMSAVLSVLQAGSERDRMAYGCIVALFLDKHGAAWENLTDTATVASLSNRIHQLSQEYVTDPAAKVMQEELLAWAKQNQREEEQDAELDTATPPQ